jgi:hypothetical protein
MNLLEEILRRHSQSQSDKIARYVGADEYRFAELMTLFLNGPYRVTQRAAWPLSHCVEKNPLLLKPYYKKIFMMLEQTDVHDAVKRNILRMLQFVKIPRVWQSRAVNNCFALLSEGEQPIAIRVFAMTVLANIARDQPDLKNEIIPVIEDQLPYASAGFSARGKRVLNELKK